MRLMVLFCQTDEQLAQAQQGLKGLAMPNFNSVGSALAKECNIEPEEEPETEEEGECLRSLSFCLLTLN